MGKVIAFLFIASIIIRIAAISIPFLKYVAIGCWAAVLLLILVLIFKKMFID